MSKIAAVNSSGKTVLVANNPAALLLIGLSFSGIQQVASMLTDFTLPSSGSYAHLNAGLQRMFFTNRIVAWANDVDRIDELTKLAGQQLELETANKAEAKAKAEADKAEAKAKKAEAKAATGVRMNVEDLNYVD